MPEECLIKLAAAVHFETFDKGNAAAELQLHNIRVKRFFSVDAYIRRGSAKQAMGDAVGALVDWAAAFGIGNIAEKLLCLSQMMSLTNHWRSCEEVSRPGLELERAARDNKYADVWAEVAVRPLEIMGQTMQIRDVSTVSAAAVLQFYLAEVRIRLAVVINCDDDSWQHKWRIQRTDRYSFKFSELSYNKQLLQQAACKLYLNEPTDALDDLNEAVRDYLVYPSDYASDYALVYQYRAAAHQALGNDVAAAEDLASAEHLTPHPDFVVINHSTPEDGMAMNDGIVGDKRQVYMAAAAGKIMAQHR